MTLLVKPSLPHVEELGKLMQWPGEVADWLKSNELAEELHMMPPEKTSENERAQIGGYRQQNGKGNPDQTIVKLPQRDKVRPEPT